MTIGLSSPDLLFREFAKRANAGDVDGLVALYTKDAKVYFAPEKASTGHDEIRASVIEMLKLGATFSDDPQRKSIVVGDVALTSASFRDGKMVTAEVAQRQSDGSWLWVLDHPNFTAENYLASE